MSVDQEIARYVGGDSKKPSLQFGVQSTMYNGTEVRTVMSYRGSDDPISNEVSPYSMFDFAFSELGVDPAEFAALRARRHSVLDAVGRQYDALLPKLGADDRRKLEQHLTAVREVERRLDSPDVVLGGACQPSAPGDPASLDLDDPGNYGIVGSLQMDLLIMALACNITKVATLQWSAATNNRPYPFLTHNGEPLLGDEHVMGHEPDENVETWEKLRVIKRWYFEQFAYFLGRLDSIQEASGTLLDNTVILVCSEIPRGNNHSQIDMPFILAGSAGGYLQTGRSLEFSGHHHNDLLVSVLNAMGIEATAFGHEGYCAGPLPGLTG
jgi:hypothetical protein